MPDYQTPKINWKAADAVGAGDFNRIENNIAYLHSYNMRCIIPTDNLLASSITPVQMDLADFDQPFFKAKEFKVVDAGYYKLMGDWGVEGPGAAFLKIVCTDAFGTILQINDYSSSTMINGFNYVTPFVAPGGHIQLFLKPGIKSPLGSAYALLANVHLKGSLAVAGERIEVIR